MTLLEKTFRPIRSFVLRQGRMTVGQQRALGEHWPQYGLRVPHQQETFEWEALFARKAPKVLEIGFGMGDSLVNQAHAHPEIDFIGIEVHQPGVGHCIAKAHSLGLTNLKLFNDDALQVLAQCIPDGSLDKVLLLFPDPWPKKRHTKRRIVQPVFATLIAQKLKKKGLFHLATDWQPYADHMLTVLENCPAFLNYFGPMQFAPNQFERLQTKFERRGEKLGHGIWDLVYQRQ